MSHSPLRLGRALKQLLTSPRSKKTRERKQRRLLLESLEDRRLLAVSVWDGGTDANLAWSDSENWVGDIAPRSGDELVFAGTGGVTTNDLPAHTEFNTIRITGSGFTLGGNAIDLRGGLTDSSNSATGNTVDLPITLLNAMYIVGANAGHTLTFGPSSVLDTANLVGTTNIQGTSALNFDATGTIRVSGVIQGGGSVAKYGGGMVDLAGPNTYEGITGVSQGVLRVSQLVLREPQRNTRSTRKPALVVRGQMKVVAFIAPPQGDVIEKQTPRPPGPLLSC